VMPYDTYRLYQVERARSCAEVRRADERLGRREFRWEES
jgi:hypothetical protein